MSFGHALYYPFINLTNKNWLKHAFIFWDKISRIVPSSVTPSDSEEIIKIKYETGFIENYSPDRGAISNTLRTFSEYLERILNSEDFYKYYWRKSRNYFDDWEYEHWRRFREDFGLRRDILESIAKSSGTYLHVQKIDRNLKEKLFTLGLAIPGENEYEDWIKIDNEIGFIYMSFLAKSISKEKTIPIVTDIEQFYSATILFEPKLFRDYQSEFEYKLGNLIIGSCVPKDINSVPFDKLIEIRKKYNAERMNFFNMISDLCLSLPEIDNETALEDALNHYGELLIKQTKELKDIYESFKIETVFKFLNISVPSALVSISNIIPITYKPFGIGAGIIFGLVSSAASVKKEKKQLKERPLSYLLNLNSELSGEDIFKKINDTVKGIRKWGIGD
jgi:hypothetical protein